MLQAHRRQGRQRALRQHRQSEGAAARVHGDRHARPAGDRGRAWRAERHHQLRASLSQADHHPRPARPQSGRPAEMLRRRGRGQGQAADREDHAAVAGRRGASADGNRRGAAARSCSIRRWTDRSIRRRANAPRTWEERRCAPATIARWIAVLWAAALPAVVLPSGASAQSVADFYRGKRINMYVSSTVGGGYDQYARLLAKHIVRYIPGNPSIVVQNMVGAEGIKAANYIFTVAPQDGTAIGGAVAQYRPRAALRSRQPGDPVRRPQDALDRLAAAGGRDRHLLDQEGPAHASTISRPARSPPPPPRATRRPRSIRACSTRSTASRSR